MVLRVNLDTPTTWSVGFWANLYVRGNVYAKIMNNYYLLLVIVSKLTSYI